MYIIIGMIFIIIGLMMLICPKTIFEIAEQWKNNYNSEPSKIYIISIRFGGSMFLVIGLLSIYISVM